MQQTLRLLICSYTMILASIVSFVIVVSQTSDDDPVTTNASMVQQLVKTEMLQELASIAQMRSNLIHSTLRTDDPLVQTSFSSNYSDFTQSYNATRRALDPLLTPREKESLLESDRLKALISDLDQQVILFFFDGSRFAAMDILQNEVLPKTTRLLSLLSGSIGAFQLDLHNRLQLGLNQFESDRSFIYILAVSVFVISLLVSVFSIFYFRKQLQQSQEVDSYIEEKVLEATESLLDTQKELIEDNTLLARLASTDSLTGLFNRSHINNVLMKEHSRFQRYKQYFGIIMLDIDHFKQVNDTYGHDAGDKALVQLSKLLNHTVRKSDYAARWGGEEFLITCTTIDDEDLFPIAENIRQVVLNSDFGLASKLTISLGCAIIQPNESIDELIKRADIALYAAKNNGRNQTVVSEFIDIN